MKDAIAQLVHDGDTVVIEGFTHLICFAAGHEIIRQKKKNLTLARLTPDLIYDQMIEAGVAKPPTLEIEEYSHFGMVARLSAGAANLPFWPLKNYEGTDIPGSNPK